MLIMPVMDYPFVTLTVEKLRLQILFQFHDNVMTTKMDFTLTSNLEQLY
jgi:hypothetical protein